MTRSTSRRSILGAIAVVWFVGSASTVTGAEGTPTGEPNWYFVQFDTAQPEAFVGTCNLSPSDLARKAETGGWVRFTDLRNSKDGRWVVKALHELFLNTARALLFIPLPGDPAKQPEVSAMLLDFQNQSPPPESGPLSREERLERARLLRERILQDRPGAQAAPAP